MPNSITFCRAVALSTGPSEVRKDQAALVSLEDPLQGLAHPDTFNSGESAMVLEILTPKSGY